MSEEKVFPEGFIVKKNAGAPDFVIANVSIHMKEFIEWAKKYHKDGWINLEELISKKGKPYAVLNQYDPSAKKEKPKKEESFKDDSGFPS